jgi:phage shock protein C
MRNGQRLTRSHNRWLSGVCSGIAEFLGWPPGAVRVLYIFLSLITGVIPGLIVYIMLWAAMPSPPGRRRRKFRLEDFRVQ